MKFNGDAAICALITVFAVMFAVALGVIAYVLFVLAPLLLCGLVLLLAVPLIAGAVWPADTGGDL